VGGFLLSVLGFRGALSVMATGVLIVLLLVMAFLPAAIGQAKKKAAFTGILSNSKGMNRLSLARRLLLHGERLRASARDASLWRLVPVAGVSASLWGAVVLAAAAGFGAMLLPPVTSEVDWNGAKGDD
jgi:hypothetical protein